MRNLISMFLWAILLFYTTQNWAKENWRNYTDPLAPIYQGLLSDSTTTSTRPGTEYKVVTYNIKFSRELKKIAEYFKSSLEVKDADVIFLQEVAGIPGDPTRHAAHYLAKELNFNYIYAPAFIHPKNDFDFGVAILSKFPIRHFQKIILPHPDFKQGTQRIALYAQIDDHGKLLDVVSMHLETLQFTKFRIDQTRASIAPILNSSNPVFIAGDFNSAPFWQRWTLIQFMQKQNLEYFSRNHGGTGPLKMKIDLAFGKNIEVLQTGILKIPTSDHNPVWFKVKL